PVLVVPSHRHVLSHLHVGLPGPQGRHRGARDGVEAAVQGVQIQSHVLFNLLHRCGGEKLLPDCVSRRLHAPLQHLPVPVLRDTGALHTESAQQRLLHCCELAQVHVNLYGVVVHGQLEDSDAQQQPHHHEESCHAHGDVGNLDHGTDCSSMECVCQATVVSYRYPR
ncbi:hypothetical protein B484DRAFT_226843, partial [Ochromonadaceae sp. CCMP2298]